MTVVERVRWCVENRADSARQLSLKAGLSAGTVQKILERGGTRVASETLTAIASAARVSLRWLSTGQGSPDSDDTTREPSTTESVVPHMANAIGFDDALAAAKLRRPDFTDEDWTAVGQASKYIVRGIVQPEELIELAQMRQKLANPERLQAAWDRQNAMIAELRAQIAAAAAAPSKSKGPAKPTRKPGGSR